MTDAELRDAAVAELKRTTVGYSYFTKKGTVPGPSSRWGKALALLEQIASPPPPPPPPPSGRCYWGVRIDGQFYWDAYDSLTTSDAPWAAADPSPNNWDLFELHAGRKVSVIQWGGSGSSFRSTFDTRASQLCAQRGAFNLYGNGATAQQMIDLAADSDANGVISMIESWARAVAADRRPMIYRPLWEMNGSWSGQPAAYAWQEPTTPRATYIAAWRNLYARVKALASNVAFCWCPNIVPGGADPTGWWPGASYVDWLGMDGYCWSNYRSPAVVFDATYDIITRLAPGKPICIAEWGCEAATGAPGKAEWTRLFLEEWVPAHPDVKCIALFNEAGGVKWPHLEVGDGVGVLGGSAQAAFAAAIANPYYIGPAVLPLDAPPPVP